jgi:hypothetical protein
MTIAMVIVWAKYGLDKEKERRNWKMGLFFSCCLILLLFFGLSFSMQVNWILPLSLCAAVTIMVKKGYSIVLLFLYFVDSGNTALAVWQQRWWWRQHGSGGQLGGGGGSLAEVQF